jgi:hypothetical protein
LKLTENKGLMKSDMFKNAGLTIAGIALTAVLAIGCKPHSPSQSETSPGYFQTPFQEEAQFIVETIVSDLAEQMFYAASHHLPDTNYFQVTATEKPRSSKDAPVYEVQIRLDPKQGVLTSEVNLNGPIWSSEVYHEVAKDLAKSVGLTAGNENPSADPWLISKLTDGTPETIQQENEYLSSALEDDFKNPQLHEEAAALLGAFLLRDHSGHFFEIRSPLSLMTAHLVMAQFLNGTNSFGLNGQMAEAMLLTLVNNESQALNQLDAIDTNNAAVAPMVRALWTRNTGDYRLLDRIENRSPMENIEWFSARARNVSVNLAWLKLDNLQQSTIDFVRSANEWDYSVEVGHQISRISLPLELREAARMYELSHHQQLAESNLVEALNVMPERCFSTDPDGTVHVCIIGWGEWADFLQRHLCHAIQRNFNFLENIWAVESNARAFAYASDQDFGGLRLYPFAQRFDFADIRTYHQSVDNGFKVTVTTPQLTPADCWNWICFKPTYVPLYSPNPAPHVNEWHYHNPPPGTAYDLAPRLHHPSLIDGPNSDERLENLREMAPYDSRLMDFLLKKKFGRHPTYGEAVALYGNILPYSLPAMRTVAGTASDQPQQYEKLMSQAGQLDPTCYEELGDYEVRRHNDDLAAQYLDQGCNADPDADHATDYAAWRVRYYLKKGNTEKARKIADFSGQVYSYYGLQAEGIFFETTSNYDEACDWYKKIEDRYHDFRPLVGFCIRYKMSTGDARFDTEVEKRLGNMFPDGVQKVSLADFPEEPPRDGVLIRSQNDLLTSSGLKAGDVIVALGGIRTHTLAQYEYVRYALTDPGLDLIVWQDNAYHEIKASPPNHRFNVDFVDYVVH